MSHRLLGVILVLGCATLAGCSGAEPAATVATTTAPTRVLHGAVSFRTASGAIGCTGYATAGTDELTCEARPRAWALPPRPATCDMEWAGYVHLEGAGPASIGVCTSNPMVGDPQTPGGPWRFTGPLIDDGAAVRIGRIVCRAGAGALTCRNAEDRGVVVSTDRVAAF